MTTVAEMMTPDPITIAPSDSVQQAAQLMDELNVGCLPVCADGQLMGIVTDRDITVRSTAMGFVPALTEVERVMSERVRSCSLHHSADEVLAQMASVQIRRMPVLDGDRRLVGMVSLGDLSERRQGGVEETLRRISTPSAPDRVLVVAAVA